MPTAKCAVFDARSRKFELRELPLPEPQGAEVLVRNAYVTLCRSDLKTYTGARQERNPTILGHESCGEIVQFGPSAIRKDVQGRELAVGDRISWAVFASPPEDPQSVAGRPQKAAGLFKYGHEQLRPDSGWHGGLSEYTLLRPHSVLAQLPDDLPWRVAALINCAVATMAGGLRLAGPVKGKRVLVSGAGTLGLMGCAMCKQQGAAEVVALEPDAERRSFALNFGASHALEPGQPLPETDLVLESSGQPKAMEQTLHALATGGQAIWLGAVFPQRQVQVSAEQLIRRLHRIQGLHNYNKRDFREAVQFLSQHATAYPFGRLVEKEFSLAEVTSAFEYAIEECPYRVGVRIY